MGDGRARRHFWPAVIFLLLTAVGCQTAARRRETVQRAETQPTRSSSVAGSPRSFQPLVRDRFVGLADTGFLEPVAADESGTDSPSRIAPAAAEAEETAASSKGPATSPSPGLGAKPTADLPPDDASVTDLLPSPSYVLDLGAVLALADAQNPNVAVARERINEAYARVDKAESLWLPSIRAGMNYAHHEGRTQNIEGDVFDASRSSLYGGLGAGAVGGGQPSTPGVVAQFRVSDAVFQPRIAAAQAMSRRFAATAARNDILRSAAVAYLELVRAEHGLSIAAHARRDTRVLAEIAGEYARTGRGPRSDEERMLAEVSLREAEVVRAVELVEVASARLSQIVHGDQASRIGSGEPAVVPLAVVREDLGRAECVATGLSRRPELAEQRHLVNEAVERLRREQYAPLVPSVLLGTSYGGMGGSQGGAISDSGDRWDVDALAYWEIRNLGFGERAARDETASAVRQNRMRQVAVLDQVAREVTEAHAQVNRRRTRIELAGRGVRAAEESYALNKKRMQDGEGLPIEALQAVQALTAARRGYLDAVIDYDVAQFELCRAIGWFTGPGRLEDPARPETETSPPRPAE